jgi:hypothetical protein
LRSSIAALALLLWTAPAHAFQEASQFFGGVPGSATFGASGEGVYFTGAPRFASQTCASCHTDGPQAVGLRLNSDKTDLFAVGYTPGAVYQLQVEIVDEKQGTQYGGATCTEPPGKKDTYPYAQCNNNGFALEIDDVADRPLTGGFCTQAPGGKSCPMADPTSDQTVIAPDGDTVFANRLHQTDMPKVVRRNGATSWSFWWIAPAAGTGPVTVRVSAVDGNGGTGSATNDQDPFGDDTVSAQFFIPEEGAPTVIDSAAGCSLGGAPAPWSLVITSLCVGWGLRRSRGRARAIWRNRTRPGCARRTSSGSAPDPS